MSKRIRIFSGCTGDQKPFVQLLHENAEDPDDRVVLAQLTPQEAVQMGVYLIGAGSEAQCDAATVQYLMGAAQAGGDSVAKSAEIAGKAVDGMRQLRRKPLDPAKLDPSAKKN